MNSRLKQLLAENPGLWRGAGATAFAADTIATGYAALDALLPGGGWPGAGLVDVVCHGHGIGELRLLLPLLRHISQRRRWLFWINPPHTPYVPALQRAGVDSQLIVLVNSGSGNDDLLWSIEKVLQSEASGVLLAWPGRIPHARLRRLQLSAISGNTLGFLFRPQPEHNSPAVLRIALAPADDNTRDALHVDILKARGTFQRRRARIDLCPL